jgi:hypothetical protein
LSLLFGAKPGLLARLDSLNFFFHSPEPHFGTPAQFLFLRALARLGLEVTPLFFRPTVCLIGFGLAQRRQLGLMRLLGGAHAFIRFGAAILLNQFEARQFFLCPRDFPVSNPTPRIFFRSIAGLGFDSLALMFRALSCRLFFLLMPSLLFQTEPGLGGDSLGFGLRPARFFFFA